VRGGFSVGDVVGLFAARGAADGQPGEVFLDFAEIVGGRGGAGDVVGCAQALPPEQTMCHHI